MPPTAPVPAPVVGPRRTSPRPPSRTRWLIAVAVVAGVLLAVLALVLLMSDPRRQGALLGPVELTTSTFAGGFLAAVAWRHRRARRLAFAWGAIAVAHICYAAADWLWVVGGATLAGTPLSLPMNILYMAFYPAFLLGVLALPRVPLARTRKLKLALEVAVVMLASALVLWSLLVLPRVRIPGQPLQRLLLTLAYPVGDLAMVWVVLTLLFAFGRRRGGRAAVYGWLAGGTAALVVADILQGFVVLDAKLAFGGWASLGFVASHLLVGLAALRELEYPQTAAPAGGGSPPARPDAGSLYIAFAALGIAWFVVVALSLENLTLIGAALTIAMVALVLARQAVSVAENARLYRRLAAARDELESRVRLRTAELAHEVEQRTEAQQRLSSRVADLTVLNAIATLGVECETEASLVARATEVLRETLYPDNCGILLLDEDTGTLRHAPSFHTRAPQLSTAAIPLGEGVTGRVAASGEPRLVPDGRSDPDYLAYDPEMRSELCVPLKVGGRVLGVIDTERREVDGFSVADQQILTTLASQLATAIDRLRDIAERRQAEQRVRRQLERLATLRAIDVAISSSRDLTSTLALFVERAHQALDADGTEVLLLGDGEKTLTPTATAGLASPCAGRQVPLADCLAARALESAEPMALHRLPPERRTDACPLLPPEGEFAAAYAAPLVAADRALGVLLVVRRRPFEPDQEWLDFLAALAGQAGIAVDTMTLFADLERSNRELARAYDTTLEGWSRALELRDRETQGHTLRVSDLTVRLARAMELPEAEMVHVRRGALLHDIGKMGIPDSILLKPGPLDEDEWTVMRRHPEYARILLEPIPFLRPALVIPACHHERWDGTGYPTGLRGEAIPLAARIFAVVDAWDALSSDRPYRSAWSAAEIRDHLRAEAGKAYDPAVVAAFLDLIGG